MHEMQGMALITRNLVNTLRSQLEQSQAAYWLVAFTMVSGVELLLPALQSARDRQIDIKILTGDYLYVTEPEALSLLLEAVPEAEIRLWKSQGQSFHAKAYLFEHRREDTAVIVGSSNWSRSALTGGVEWNLLVRDDSIRGVEQFMTLFYSDRTVPLNAVTLVQYRAQHERFRTDHPDLARTWTEGESVAAMFDDTDEKNPGELWNGIRAPQELTPRPVQSEALQALASTREEGYQKALVVLPTGLGKTYLAAFFAKQFHRVLFVAHREEILSQSLRVFHEVMPERSFTRYAGKSVRTRDDGLFASVYTLAGDAHRNRFGAHAFDLAIVDDFHHAAASS
jgi:HKD family nuclease